MSLIKQFDGQGQLSLFCDYRSGTFADWSKNYNASTVTGVKLASGKSFALTNNATTAQYSSFANPVGTPTSNMTWFFKVKLERYQANGHGILAQWTTSGNQRSYQFNANATTNTTLDMVYSTNGTATATTSITNVLQYGQSVVVMVVKATTTATVYVNGLSVGSGTFNPFTTSTSPLFIGNGSITDYSLDGAVEYAGIISTNLTATQVAKLYSELENTVNPTQPISKAWVHSTPTVGQASLAMGYTMQPSGVTLYDVSTNNNNATKTGTTCPMAVNTSMGVALRCDGVDTNFTSGSAVPSGLSANGSCMIWIRPLVLSSFKYPVNATGAGSQRFYLETNNGGANWSWGLSNPAVSGLTLANSCVLNTWHHLCLTWTDAGSGNANYTFYQNGRSVATATGTQVSAWSTLKFGGLAAAGNAWFGEIAKFEMHTRALTSGEVANDYAQLGSVVAFKTSWGVPANQTNISSTVLENTPFILSGTSPVFKISTENLSGKITKRLDFVSGTNARVMLNSEKWSIFPQPTAFGTWTFTTKVASSLNFLFIGAVDNVLTNGSQNGYYLNITSADATLKKIVAGTASTIGSTYTAANTGVVNWKITRTNPGAFTVYRNGVSVITVTDRTTITSAFMGIYPATTSDYIYLSDKDGGSSITKYTGVI